MLINKHMREELTTEKIIENCKKFRGEEYDYSKVKKMEKWRRSENRSNLSTWLLLDKLF